ncbi:hypothetical protein GCM10018952_02730 [Streptosporangium vulgare]
MLGGAISPIDGVGPDDLNIRELMTRLADGQVTELILATDPNLEGGGDGDLSGPSGQADGTESDTTGQRSARGR